MRTENDLRDAIDVLAGESSDSAELLNRLGARSAKEHGPTFARALKPLIAALVVVAVAVAAVALLGRNTNNANPPVGRPHSSPLMWKFSVGHVPGYTITRTNIFRPSIPAADISQSASITATGNGKTGGTIEFDTVPGKLVQRADSTTVGGVRYYFRNGHHVKRQGGLTPAQYADPWKAAGQDAYGPELSWHYPDGSQFVISGTFGFDPKTYNYNNTTARTVLMRIALAVRTSRQDSVTMPFRLRALPNGLVPVSLRDTPPEQQNPPGSLAANPLSACLNYATPQQPSPQDPTESILTVCRAKISTTRQATLDALSFNADSLARYVVRSLPDGTLLAVGVGIGHTDTVSQDDLQRITDQADVSPRLSATTTWLKVN